MEPKAPKAPNLWLVPFLLALSACATSDAPRLVVLPAPGVRPAVRVDDASDYRTAAATISHLFERRFGFAAFPVTLAFYPSASAFEKALLDVGYDADLARSTAGVMTAVGGHRGVLLNGAKFSAMPAPERMAMLAHEMGHCVQYELGGGKRGASDQWLREGFADWLAIRVLEDLDAASLAEIRRDRRRVVRAAGRSRMPRFADLATFPSWVRAGQRHGDTLYAVAFLAADALLERHGMAAVLAYFKRFATSDDRAGNFRAAFGRDVEEFERTFFAGLFR